MLVIVVMGNESQNSRSSYITVLQSFHPTFFQKPFLHFTIYLMTFRELSALFVDFLLSYCFTNLINSSLIYSFVREILIWLAVGM